mmetsp:Transcript_7530/g.11399  ORF Transcript_7530/g.11399 Transcript_7530/m.11399 type:complete len:354 (+) Transcript_7530:104-1165(+)
MPSRRVSKKSRRVRVACTNCKRSKARCGAQRPCKRCVERGLKECIDAFPRRVGRRRNHFFDQVVSEKQVEQVNTELQRIANRKRSLPEEYKDDHTSKSLRPKLNFSDEAFSLDMKLPTIGSKSMVPLESPILVRSPVLGQPSNHESVSLITPAQRDLMIQMAAAAQTFIGPASIITTSHEMNRLPSSALTPVQPDLMRQMANAAERFSSLYTSFKLAEQAARASNIRNENNVPIIKELDLTPLHIPNTQKENLAHVQNASPDEVPMVPMVSNSTQDFSVPSPPTVNTGEAKLSLLNTVASVTTNTTLDEEDFAFPNLRGLKLQAKDETFEPFSVLPLLAEVPLQAEELHGKCS